MTQQRPPRDITPRAFFEEWLPNLYAGASRQRSRPSPAEVRVRVRLDGEAGGAWDLEVKAGTLVVTPPSGSEPSVTVSQTEADWRAVAVGEAGAIDLAPPDASPLDLLFIDARSRDLLAAIRGTVRFEVTGYNGRVWSLTAKFGDQPFPVEPDAVIAVDAETYGKLRARTMQPPEAYFSGKIHLTGNTGLAMQIGMAMMSRFV